MYWAPRHVAKLWGVKSIYITENGTSAVGRTRRADGSFYDVDRIMYLRNYLTHLQRATSEGVPCRRLLPVEPDGQFRMDRTVSQSVSGSTMSTSGTQRRTPKAERIVLSRGRPAKRGGLSQID